ncbi:hypothetical protein [Actinoplanes philippinensis]|uniref:hypothetical protein n=1 Tax=Actinoplanes philippinensis TaxID=35752 RepID=UPI003402E266
MRDGLWWIGGSPCAGKSTVAGRIAGRRGVPVYSCDDAFDRHADGGPVLRKVTAMGVGERRCCRNCSPASTGRTWPSTGGCAGTPSSPSGSRARHVTWAIG